MTLNCKNVGTSDNVSTKDLKLEYFNKSYHEIKLYKSTPPDCFGIMVYGVSAVRSVLGHAKIRYWFASCLARALSKAGPHCVMWCIWRERNARSFEDIERNIPDLKNVSFKNSVGLDVH